MPRIIFYISVIFLTACYSDIHAPVEELNPQYKRHQAQDYYQVRQGDTLYAIAFLYNQNTQDLARINHLFYPYTLKVGQNLIINPQASRSSQRPIPVKTPFFKRIWGKWLWPTHGQLMSSDWRDTIAKKGITIRGRYNQPVFAAQSGTVAYAGHGLPGYGNLILIMHANQLISAYAYNARILVKEGQHVKKGQLVARMGYMNKKIAALHFEIRYRGQAQNPMHYLP